MPEPPETRKTRHATHARNAIQARLPKGHDARRDQVSEPSFPPGKRDKSRQPKERVNNGDDGRLRLKENSEEFRDRYRWRAGVEATMSRFKYQMGMAQLRIGCMVRVKYTARLRALGLNIHRVAVWRKAVAAI